MVYIFTFIIFAKYLNEIISRETLSIHFAISQTILPLAFGHCLEWSGVWTVVFQTFDYEG